MVFEGKIFLHSLSSLRPAKARKRPLKENDMKAHKVLFACHDAQKKGHRLAE